MKYFVFVTILFFNNMLYAVPTLSGWSKLSLWHVESINAEKISIEFQLENLENNRIYSDGAAEIDSELELSTLERNALECILDLEVKSTCSNEWIDQHSIIYISPRNFKHIFDIIGDYSKNSVTLSKVDARDFFDRLFSEAESSRIKIKNILGGLKNQNKSELDVQIDSANQELIETKLLKRKAREKRRNQQKENMARSTAQQIKNLGAMVPLMQVELADLALKAISLASDASLTNKILESKERHLLEQSEESI